MTQAVLRAVRHLEVPAAVTTTFILQAMISLMAACIPIFAPEIALARGWNVTLVAFYPAIVFSVAFLISFIVPNLLGRLGGMGLTLACVATSAFGLLCLLPSSIVLVVVAPLAIGAATGAMNPATAQILGPRTSPKTMGLIMSIKQTGVPVGGVLAGALVPVLVRDFGWQKGVLVLALGCVAIGMAFFPSVPWLNGTEKPARLGAFRPFDPVKRLAAIRGMLKLLLAATTFGAMQQCLRAFFAVYLVHDLGFDLATAGLAFSISQAAGIAGQVLWAAMSDRALAAQAVMTLVGALMTAAAVMTALCTPGWPVAGVFAVAALYGVSAAGFIPVVLGEVARRAPPGQAGALTSGAQIFLTPSGLVGPLAFGAVAATFNYADAFVTLAGCTLAGSIIAATHRPWRVVS
ncbi:MAG TPA: MFS transporter [Stellaceae bacterium]|nr:MFS transporter [Stellaceae bacterium]